MIYVATMAGKEQGKNRHNDLGIIRDYNSEAERLFLTARQFGISQFFKYDNEWLKNSQYYQDAKDVLDEPSFGWAFKPICIYESLKQIDNGDVLIWADSNHAFSQSPVEIVKIAEQYGIFCHEHWMVVYPNKDWTRRDMFITMGCDDEKFWNARQMQVNVMAFCKNNFTMEFVKEWVDFSTKYETMIGYNKYPNFPGFRDHRHEQSIFSILVAKYNVPFFPDPYSVVPELDGINCKQ